MYPQNSSARLTETSHIPACPICANETEGWLEESKDRRKRIPITSTIITAKLHWIYQNEGRFLTCFWIMTWQTWNKIKRSLLNFNSLRYTNGRSYLSLADVTIHTAEMKLDALQAISQTVPLTSYLHFLISCWFFLQVFFLINFSEAAVRGNNYSKNV